MRELKVKTGFNAILSSQNLTFTYHLSIAVLQVLQAKDPTPMRSLLMISSSGTRGYEQAYLRHHSFDFPPASIFAQL